MFKPLYVGDITSKQAYNGESRNGNIGHGDLELTLDSAKVLQDYATLEVTIVI